MEQILRIALGTSLAIHIAMIAVCVWRVWNGENVIDRLIGADLLGTLTLAVLVLVALILYNSIYLDVALGLALLGFISTLALAKYIVDQAMY
jgi:multisubunit Na+/H+ antiporter MnhF subunit